MSLDVLLGGEMTAYREARARNEIELAWHHLERAHIVSQPYLGPHLASHWAMLLFALSERDAKEVTGQIVRLALAPLGAISGRIPVGNTGRANVGAFKAMPIPADLTSQLKDNGL